MATTAAPYGFWATNPTKKLAYWVYLLGQPLSRNRVFQNFSGEPPPPPPPLIYINDLPNISIDTNFVLFADDTNIFVKAVNKMLAYEKANKVLEQLNLYMLVNKLHNNAASLTLNLPNLTTKMKIMP